MHVLHIEYTNNDCISFTLCLSCSLLLNITFVAVVFGTVRIVTSVWILSLLDFLPSQYCSVYHIPTRPTISELVVFVRRLIASSIALWYRSRLTSANFHQEWKWVRHFCVWVSILQKNILSKLPLENSVYWGKQYNFRAACCFSFPSLLMEMDIPTLAIARTWNGEPIDCQTNC